MKELVVLVEERGIKLTTPGLPVQRITTGPLIRSVILELCNCVLKCTYMTTNICDSQQGSFFGILGLADLCRTEAFEQ